MARNISKRFGGIHAVDDVSFTVRDRTLHALIGPNGAGKTTAFNLLSASTPDSGAIELAGAFDRRPAPGGHHGQGRRPLVPDHQSVLVAAG